MAVSGITRILALLAVSQLAEGFGGRDELHPCYHERTCTWPFSPMQCNYTFVVEWSMTMSECPEDDPEGCIVVNGVSRPVITTSGGIPGPSIHVCEGDVISVSVTNMLEGVDSDTVGTTVHWHGIHGHPPDIDGTPGITQCPIYLGETFTYTFQVLVPGTHFWHSQVPLQRQDGMYGSLVVRRPEELDLHSRAYDFDLMEHTMIVSDWYNRIAIQEFYPISNPNPDSILINGRGSETAEHATKRGLAFDVKRGKRYRFRITSNAAANCPMKVSVDNHTLAMIASDGKPFKSVEVDSFAIFSGERFDFVLDADRPVDSYWMRVDGLGDCENKHALAMIRYEGAEEKAPSLPENCMRGGKTLNPYNTADDADNMYISHLEALDPDEKNVLTAYAERYYIAMGLNRVNHPRCDKEVTAQFNHISFLEPPVPLLRRHGEIDPSLFCNSSTADEAEFTECIYTINIPLGQVVEFVLVDEGNLDNGSHPVHLHGYTFRVVAMEKLGASTTVEEVMALRETPGRVQGSPIPPLKDTVSTPNGGYTVIRFAADNPGWWFFHCQREFHTKEGMAVVLHVGTDGDLDPPPPDLPACNIHSDEA